MWAQIGRFVRSATLAAVVLSSAGATTAAGEVGRPAEPDSTGIIRVKSAHPIDETVARLRAAIEAKGIVFFALIDQAALAAARGVEVRPSTLLEFGNPALGARFVAANPLAGLDWPVRLLVMEDERGEVWAAYTDFAQIARRYGIAEDDPAFATASRVVASITSGIAAQPAP